jgi:uncharacterized protein with PQ loop repeat
MNSLEIIGFIGSLSLAVCGIPQAWMSFKQGHSEGISLGFLLLWTVGEIFTILYVLPMANAPLLLNYSCNLIFLSVIWRYRLCPRNLKNN